MELISNADLRLEQVPPSNPTWKQFTRFALTIGGYSSGYGFPSGRYWLEVLNQPSGHTLTELRVTLFRLQRTIKWVGPASPDFFEKERARVSAVLDEIRTKIANRDIE